MCDANNPEFPGSCTTDADCTEKPHGQCGIYGQIAECACSYGCVTDSDCTADQVCDCGDPVGKCVRADCKTDADCAGDSLCVAYVSDPGCGGTAFTCQTAKDTCASEADCTGIGSCTKVDDHLECQQEACAIGRPFLIAGDHRTAAPVERGDWITTLAPCVDALSPELRETLAGHWREVGLMEHASIAAFARFALQLLSVGAPPELLLQTQDAMRDETHHATVAFALSSAYAGREVGPGQLPLHGALDDQEPEDILRLVIREGCIGETVAAVEAAEAAARAEDPTVKKVLERIAADEQRHADLAWRYVAWAISEDASFASVLLSEVVAKRAERHAATADDRRLLAHGMVTDAVRAEIRERVLRDVVRPTARALTEQRAAA